jgi:hypothetical protein
VQNDDQPLAHFVTSVTGINGLSEPVEVHIIITRPKEKEVGNVQRDSAGVDYADKSTPYIHPISTSLSEDNKRGLDNLAYWRNGFRGSRVYILNQALAQYLAHYQESKQAVPANEL